MNRGLLLAAVLAACLLALPARAANIVIHDNDSVGEGFNDPTPFTPVGGNTAVTVGDARLFAFTYAANLWGRQLASNVVIEVNATIDPLTCSDTSAILGSAGAFTVHRDFPGAPLADTWYPQALANALAGTDLDPGSPDLLAVFSSALDGGNCLGGTRWYYGVDGAPPPGEIDFVTVVLHELGHGLGFQTFVTLSTGAKFLGHDDAFERKLEQHGAVPASYPTMTDAQRVAASTSDPHLEWLGAHVNDAGATRLGAGIADQHVRLHAPPVQQPGASVSHFSTALAPDELMEPFYTGPDHDLSLTLDLLVDLGWTMATPAAPVAVPASSPLTILFLALALFVAAAWTQRRA